MAKKAKRPRWPRWARWPCLHLGSKASNGNSKLLSLPRRDEHGHLGHLAHLPGRGPGWSIWAAIAPSPRAASSAAAHPEFQESPNKVRTHTKYNTYKFNKLSIGNPP